MNQKNDAKSIFLAAADKTVPGERQAYLDEACGGDRQLRERVEALLNAHDQPDSFLENPAVPPGSAAATLPLSPVSEGLGTVIGPYKLLQQIGEGGMGVVYLAEQSEPVRRKVALKIIKPGMDTEQVIARFEAERQALALMEHQNIARVLDAGKTGDTSGRPYFVMELVKGVPISEYCDRNKLSTRERLALFIPVCQAIQHAHQKGVIHRDIKPSNVLVCLYDGKPVPKVIDFGVAKATDQRLTERTMFTQHGQIIGTLEYMSPEQAEFNQLDVDTRSDIYSLGVLLYELLTGSTPIPKAKLREAAFVEILRTICEDEPERPSTRLSHSGDALPTISAQRQADPKKLSALLRGELDWIVMKTLEKDRTRRYESAAALAADIEHYLADEPVAACPPSAAYTFRKFARKHRVALTTAAAFVVLSVVAAVVSTWQAVRATHAEQATRIAFAAETSARLEAEQAGLAEAAARREAEAAGEQTQIALARSLYQQSRATRLAGQSGRRWQILDLIQQAEVLRAKHVASPLSAGQAIESDDSRPAEQLPTRAELRSEALAALLLYDGRVVAQLSGIAHGLSPDGRFAACMWVDPELQSGGLRLADLVADKEVVNLEGEQIMRTLGGTALALGPDGKKVAAVTMDFQGVTLSELPSGKQLRKLKLPKELQSAAPSPFETGAAAYRAGKSASSRTGGNADKDQATDATAESPRAANVSFPFAMLRSLEFSPNGRYLMGVHLNTPAVHLVVWDLESQAAEGALIATANVPAQSAVFSPDSRLLAYVAGDKQVALWNLAEARIEKEIETEWEPAGPLAFFPDGKHLAIYCINRKAQSSGPPRPGAIIRWDLESERTVDRRETPTAASLSTRLAISADGMHLALGDDSGRLHIFGLDPSVDTNTLTLEHGAIVQQLAWQPDGRLVSSGLGSLKVWELVDSPPTNVTTLPTMQPGRPAQLALSPDNRWIAVEQLQGSDVWLLDRATGRGVHKLPNPDRGPFLPYRLVFSPDSRRLVHLGFGGMIAWDVASGEVDSRLAADMRRGEFGLSVGFPADGKLLVGGLVGSQPSVQDGHDGTMLWQGKNAPAHLAVVSRDGRLVLTYPSMFMGKSATMSVYELPGGELKFQFEQPRRVGLQLMAEFSAQSRWLAAFELVGLGSMKPSGMPPGAAALVPIDAPGNNGWSGVIYDVASGTKRLELGGLSNVEQFAFDPSDRYLALALSDGAVQLWDVEGKERIFDWQAWSRESSTSRYLNFTADGSALAVLDSDRAAIQFLDLTRLHSQLETVSLSW